MSRYLTEAYLFLSIVASVLLLFILKPALMPFFLSAVLAYVSHPFFNLFMQVTGDRRRLSALPQSP